MPTAAAELEPSGDAGPLVAPVSPVFADLAGHGYVELEVFAGGTATTYEPVTPFDAEGRIEVRPGVEADYRTRIVVRRPADPARSSGVVVVEWCNVSGGLEAAADWAYLHPEILRAGHAYVAVSAQRLGVHGGEGLVGAPRVQPGGLVGASPERYAALHHPGDAYAFDIFRQIGAALRAAPAPPLEGLAARHVLAVGESQSAMFLTTYVDAVSPLGDVFGGFLVHSRSGRGASLGGDVFDERVPRGLRIRDDIRVPVLQLETETDLGERLDFAPARQPDTDRVRTWEVAGTAHADAYLIGPFASAFGWEAVNDGPHHWVAQAALDAVVRWVAGGEPPPVSAPIELIGSDPPVVVRDELGNARGGVRTPDVEVPVAALSGEAPPGADVMRSLFGSTVPLDAATLRRLYSDRSGYLAAYERSLDRTIAAGFLLAADRAELLGRAERVPFPG